MKAKPMIRPPDRLREMTAAAWETSRAFAAAFEWTLWSLDRKRDGLGEQTRLYAICEEDGSVWKFGVAVNPRERLSALQIGNPRRLVLYAYTPAEVWIEQLVHQALRRHRVAGEWFAAAPRTLTIAHLIESAHEQAWDMEQADPCPLNAGDTIAALCSILDEAAVLLDAHRGVTP